MKRNIFYLGKPGSNSHLAASRLKTMNDSLIGKSAFSDIIDSVIESSNAFAVIPLENSLSGSIRDSVDLLKERNIFIIGELILKINHCLIANLKGNKKFSVSDFKTCISHPEVFNQCSRFLKKHKNLIVQLDNDTSSGAEKLLKLNNQYCAIAGKNAARIFGLAIIAEHLEDNPLNYTRFAVVGKSKKKRGNKLSILFSLKHEPGTLVNALKPIADNGYNLTKIESRPLADKPWEYIFFADLESSDGFKYLKSCLDEINKYVIYLKVLGIYDKGKTYDS